jgi:hypothetical protein
MTSKTHEFRDRMKMLKGLKVVVSLLLSIKKEMGRTNTNEFRSSRPIITHSVGFNTSTIASEKMQYVSS